MPQLEATSSEQIQKFLNQSGGIAVVDCYATWCGPCRSIAPYVHQKSKSSGVPLIKIDVDKCSALAQVYKIQAMPTFLVIKGQYNNIVNRSEGGSKSNVDKVFDFAQKNQ